MFGVCFVGLVGLCVVGFCAWSWFFYDEAGDCGVVGF